MTTPDGAAPEPPRPLARCVTSVPRADEMKAQVPSAANIAALSKVLGDPL